MAIDQPFAPKKLKDFLFSFGKGMHNGIAPSLLPKDQVSIATNATFRGSFVRPRPAFRKLNLRYPDATTQTNFENFLFQGASDFHPDLLPDSLVASIAGRLFNIIPDAVGNASVTDVSIGGDLNSATQTQAWMWQGEKWMFVNNGLQYPLYFDGTTTLRVGTMGNTGYAVTATNLSSSAVTQPTGTVVIAEGTTLSTFKAPYFFSNQLAVGGTKEFDVHLCSHPAVGSMLILGKDLWTVVSVQDTSTSTQLTLKASYLITAGTFYNNGDPVFTAQATGGLAKDLSIAGSASGTVYLSAPYGGPVPGTIYIGPSPFTVTAIPAPAPASQTILPPGKMGAYINGRNWIVLTNGRSYIGSDLVGYTSGTSDNNFLDAILNITQNTYLAGGGVFFIPGQRTDIRAILGIPTLDAALGQGPVQIFTPNTVFSCNAPVDFDDKTGGGNNNNAWTNLTYPIQSVSGLGFGGLSQWSTVSWNTDTISRDVDGIRSTILARRDFNVWGETSISYEVDPIISTDNQSLLGFCSSIVFDKRCLMTASPFQDPQGVYFTKIIAVNSDTLSSIGGKAPSVYDGQWNGLNVLQLVTGTFSGNQRAFAFTLNTLTHTIEVWEILKSYSTLEPTGILADNNSTPIPWSFESPVLDFGQKDPRLRQLLRLINGEIYVDQMVGAVSFQVYYKPDNYPIWTLWYAWQDSVNTGTPIGFPQFRPRMRLGEPSPADMDFSLNRPLREAYLFQFKIVITGQCRFKGARFEAVTLPEPEFAQPATQVLDVTPPMNPQQIIVVVSPAGREVYSGSGSPILGTAVPSPGTPKTPTAIWIQTDSAPPMQITAIWANGIWQ